MDKYYKTSESVTEGHPDKVCDLIADGLVDLFIDKDKESFVSVKIIATRNLVFLSGVAGGYQIKDVGIESRVREVIKEIGYCNEYDFDYRTVEIINRIEINNITDDRRLKPDENLFFGSRDQGIVFGYACNETPELMPLPITLAHRLARGLAELRKNRILDYLKPDGKTQVTVEYEDGIPKRVDAVVVSAVHDIDVFRDEIEHDLKKHLIFPTLNGLIDGNTIIKVNSAERFVAGGPAVDTGVSGRKLVVDSYGSACEHGGGAFSGKDPLSNDRCGAYLARYISKNIVAAGLSQRCNIHLAYAVGSFVPLHLTIDTFGTGILSDNKIQRIIEENFDLTLSGTIKSLDLQRPIYKPTAAYGHFGRDEFPWEKTDKVDQLRKVINNAHV